jgi:hypothetical protein
LPQEFRGKYPRNTIIQVIRPLYGITESDIYWWFIYHKHHLEEFNIVISTYDPCLLILFDVFFGITGMQTDDTLMICLPEFSAKKKRKDPEGGVSRKAQGSIGKKLPDGV